MRKFLFVVSLALAGRVECAASEASPSTAKLAAGKRLYVSKCARCHKFYDPTAYPDAQWKEWMGKMRQKAHLDDEQYKQLTAYLQTVRTKPKP